MCPFRGSDEQLEREIDAVHRLVRVRLQRANDDLRELESALRELRRERRRREQASAASVRGSSGAREGAVG
ncbi:MAG TPA: hypothetical protein VMH49_00875 [Thermoplasmata archaeon]|nr:hypothetical protein [Thermoplasmata archaeon]